MRRQRETSRPSKPAPRVPLLTEVAECERFVTQHLPLVRRLCSRFSRSGVPLEDLVRVGSIGLLKAIKKFDPTRGSPFVAFAVPLIVGEVKNYFRDHGWSVKIPRKIQRQKLAVERTVEALTQILGRSPTVPELADETGFSEEEVYDTFEVVKYGRLLSLEAEYRVEGGDDTSRLQYYIGKDDPQFDEMTDRIDLLKTLRCLDEREKTIIGLKFYSGMSQAEIAGRLGISQMHVSRLQRHALGKLKVRMTDAAAKSLSV